MSKNSDLSSLDKKGHKIFKLTIQAIGRENDNDGYYGHSNLYYLALPFWSPTGPTKLGALDDNDNIGVLIDRYCSRTIEGRCSGNFGIGNHDGISNYDVGGGIGDFNLRYRIEQVSVTQPSVRVLLHQHNHHFNNEDDR